MPMDWHKVGWSNYLSLLTVGLNAYWMVTFPWPFAILLVPLLFWQLKITDSSVFLSHTSGQPILIQLPWTPCNSAVPEARYVIDHDFPRWMPSDHYIDALRLRYLFDCWPQFVAYRLADTIRLLVVMPGSTGLHPSESSFMGLFYWVPPENATEAEMVMFGLRYGRADVRVLTIDEAKAMMAVEGLSLYAT